MLRKKVGLLFCCKGREHLPVVPRYIKRNYYLLKQKNLVSIREYDLLKRKAYPVRSN